jgi:hypothetical protein
VSDSSPPAPDLPPIKEYRSVQYEFTDEQNKQISALADAMKVTSGLLLLMGMAFTLLTTLALTEPVKTSVGYG